eukprot:g8023.t1
MFAVEPPDARVFQRRAVRVRILHATDLQDASLVSGRVDLEAQIKFEDHTWHTEILRNVVARGGGAQTQSQSQRQIKDHNALAPAAPAPGSGPERKEPPPAQLVQWESSVFETEYDEEPVDVFAAHMLVEVEYGLDVVTAARRKEQFWREIDHLFSDESKFFNKPFNFRRGLDSQIGFLKAGQLCYSGDVAVEEVADRDEGDEDEVASTAPPPHGTGSCVSQSATARGPGDARTARSPNFCYRPGLRVRHATEGTGTIVATESEEGGSSSSSFAPASRTPGSTKNNRSGGTGAIVRVRFDHSPACKARRERIDKTGVRKQELIPLDDNFDSRRTTFDNIVVVGSFVRVKVENPCRGWGRVGKHDVGRVTRLEGARAICAFPAQKQWTAFVDELEVVGDDHSDNPLNPVRKLVMLRAEGPFSRNEEVFVVRQEHDDPRPGDESSIHKAVDNKSNRSRASDDRLLRMLLTEPNRWLDAIAATSGGKSKSSGGESSADRCFAVSLNDAVRGIVRTFGLPRTQRSFLRKHLKSLWEFPLTRAEALRFGVLRAGDKVLLMVPPDELQAEEETSSADAAQNNAHRDADVPRHLQEVALGTIVGRIVDADDITSPATTKVRYAVDTPRVQDILTLPREQLCVVPGPLDTTQIAEYNHKLKVKTSTEVVSPTIGTTTTNKPAEQLQIRDAYQQWRQRTGLPPILKSNARSDKVKGGGFPSPITSRDLLVIGAGGKGERCNGNYGRWPVRQYRGRPLFKNENGAIGMAGGPGGKFSSQCSCLLAYHLPGPTFIKFYWAGFWKMNYYDDCGSWYFAVRDSRNEHIPPEGRRWTNYGYTGGKAKPCPVVFHGGGAFELPASLDVGRVEDVSKLLRQARDLEASMHYTLTRTELERTRNRNSRVSSNSSPSEDEWGGDTDLNLHAPTSRSSSSSSRIDAAGSLRSADGDEITPFECACLQNACDEIDKLRLKFSWPKASEKPKPPPGLACKGGEFWQRGFTVRFVQDKGVDWGALTKAFATFLVEDVFRTDAALFLTLCGAEENNTPTPDFALEMLGRCPSFARIVYSFLGRFLGYCLYMRCRVPARLSGWVYKCLLTPRIWDVFARFSAVSSTSDSQLHEAAGVTTSGSDFSRGDSVHDRMMEFPDDCFLGGEWGSAEAALKDLSSVDSVKARSLLQLLRYEPAADVEAVFCLDFTLEFELCGARRRFGLLRDHEAAVTGGNREQYVLLVCKFLLKTSIRNSLSSLVLGFQSVVPQKCFQMLTPKLLEKMLCGKQGKITERDIADLKQVLRVTNHDGVEETPAMKELLGWFFQVVGENFSEEEQKKLLIFWIGAPMVPAAGFAELYPPITLSIASKCDEEEEAFGSEDHDTAPGNYDRREGGDPQLPRNQHQVEAAGRGRERETETPRPPRSRKVLLGPQSLPQSHVCFNRLDLPFYPSKRLLEAKLRKAIELCGNAVSIE